MSEKIRLKDIKAIRNLEIPVPEKGGLVVLRGAQGTGKSTALEAVSRALGGNVDGLTSRDGARAGKLEYGDLRLTIGRNRVTRKGELEVSEIESRLDIAALVDPGIKQPDSADAARIRALVALSGVKADPAAYYELVGSQHAFEELGIDTDTDEPLRLASRVKAALEKEARNWERNADTQKGHAQGYADRAREVDTELPHDSDALQSVYDTARDELVRLQEKDKAHKADEKAREDARASLSDAEASYDGPTLEQAQTHAAAVLEVYDTAEEVVKRLKAELEKAQNAMALAAKDCKAANRAIDTAEQHEKTVAAWRKTLDEPVISAPEPGALHGARAMVDAAREAVETGVLVREAIQAEEQATKHTRLATEAAKTAERLREKAQDVDGVLSAMLPKGKLRIEGGRLVTETDRGKSELFAELSHGERWIVALEIAAEQLPERGILPIRQEAWEGLQPANQDLLAKEMLARGIFGLTAEATDDELHATEYQADDQKRKKKGK